MPDTPTLRPANENPWYVLMTLYGEQKGEEVDRELRKLNREVWNAWASSGLEDEERDLVAHLLPADVPSDFREEHGPAIQAVHAQEMARRNSNNFSYPGFPGPADFMDLSELRLPENFLAEKLIFSPPVDFSGALFPGDADFTSSVFLKEAHFQRAEFLGVAAFDQVKFKDIVEYEQVKFEKDAWFVGASFHGDAAFFNAIFRSAASFRKVKFFGLAGFSEVVFCGAATFQEAEFIAEVNVAHAAFDNCQFLSSTSFRKTFFATYPNLSDSMLHDKTTFTEGETLWTEGKPEDEKRAMECKASCAIIRHTLGKQGLPEAEHFFFRREMGFAAQIGPWRQRLPDWIFGSLSDYGHSIERPFWSMFILGYVPAVIFTLQQWTYCECRTDIGVLGRSVALSLANLLPALGLQKLWFDPEFLASLPGWIKVLAGAQTVFALPLLFFLLLGFRTRFRMR